MRKLLLVLLLVQVSVYGQDKPLKLELGTTVYGYNIAFAGFDLDFNLHFWSKGINTFSYKTTLMTIIPASILQPVAPYILFGGLFELQYSLLVKGFSFALETGLGVASELPQLPVYEEGKGFYRDTVGTPYGVFSSGLRIGYQFKTPVKLTAFLGYRMQFPYNLTIRHIILYGLSLSYTFDFGGKK